MLTNILTKIDANRSLVAKFVIEIMINIFFSIVFNYWCQDLNPVFQIIIEMIYSFSIQQLLIMKT